jgi:hypothetical protein
MLRSEGTAIMTTNLKDRLSKSRYMEGLRCPLAVYLSVHNYELRCQPTPEQQARFDAGNRVGELARDRFPGGLLIEQDHLHHREAIEATLQALTAGAPAIFEAAFKHDNVKIRADVLRRLPEARFVGLALPRLLLRLPWGKETNAVDAFEFEELSSPPDHEEYLWGCPSVATALLLGEAFLEDGWSLRPGSAQEISGLPFALVEEDGEKRAVPCAEALFTVRAMQAVAEKGLMPLLTMKGTDVVRLAIFQSIAEPHADLAGRWG